MLGFQASCNGPAGIRRNLVGEIADMPKLLDQVREATRRLHYSIRTEDAYVDWIRRFILFHRKRHPLEMGEPEVVTFLTHLAVQRDVAASTQNQALCACRSATRSSCDGRWPGSAIRSCEPRHPSGCEPSSAAKRHAPCSPILTAPPASPLARSTGRAGGSVSAQAPSQERQRQPPRHDPRRQQGDEKSEHRPADLVDRAAPQPGRSRAARLTIPTSARHSARCSCRTPWPRKT